MILHLSVYDFLIVNTIAAFFKSRTPWLDVYEQNVITLRRRSNLSGFIATTPNLYELSSFSWTSGTCFSVSEAKTLTTNSRTNFIETSIETTLELTMISRNYASSRCCLVELAMIIECRRLIIPVFYEVNMPSDVR